MNWRIVGDLIRLRYKLMWAKTRSRNGRIAIFFSGYILLILIFVVLISGGFGSALVAVRTGKGELVARILLSVVFLQALIATLALGFGVNNLFTDVELRRYPTKALERRTVRHLVGIVDPFWAMYLMMELGLAVGLYVVGGYGFWKGTGAVLLFFIENYLLARILVEGVDRLMRRKSGSIALMVAFMAAAFLPSILAQTAAGKSSAREAMVRTLSYTPPFAAAAAMTHQGATAAAGIGLLLAWLVGLAMVTLLLEKRPQVIRRTEQTKISWGSPYDRIAAWFPAQDAPFVAFWLRFYTRNTRFRTMYLLTVPLMAFLVFNFSRTREGPVTDTALFLGALGVLPIAGFMATSRFAVNQFGYVGGGFRRLFLLPTDAGASLRAGSYASMLLGAPMVPVAVIAFAVFAPVQRDVRLLWMLLASGTTGLLVFHALGLWVTLFNPRKGNYNNNFGNDLSLGGNIVLIGGIFVSLFLPKILNKAVPGLLAPEHWWWSLGAPLLAGAFFWSSLRAAGPISATGASGCWQWRKGGIKSMDAIRVANLVKKYGTVVAVENLSLEVPQGSMFGFLGPNGSGKSTTIGCLTGLLDPTAGAIEILGQRFYTDNADIKRRMGVMPETLGLFEPLYAHEFLAFIGRMFGLEEAATRKRVSELLAALELTDTGKTLSEYSTGMRKRVAFAASVIHTPEVLFLDEPFESIDPAGVALMKQWLRRFTEHGRTVFITSHVLETVERLCDRVAIITRPGKLVWQGDITVLANDGTISFDGREFGSLEELFLHLTGERYADLNWL